MAISSQGVPSFDALYAVSDLHMGGAGPGAQIFDSGAELAGLILHLAQKPGKIALVFNGDTVDFLAEPYRGLLWGADPRRLVFDLRRRLFSQFPDTIDWASLVAYLSLPRDFDSALSKLQIKQATGAFEAAMSYADAYTRSRSVKLQSELETLSRDKNCAKSIVDSEDVRKRMTGAKKRLERLLECLPNHKAEILGRLASAEKREAEVLYRLETPAELRESNLLLASARDHYWESFLLDRSRHWAIVQCLSLRSIIARLIDSNNPDAAESDQSISRRNQEYRPQNLWTLAYTLSSYDLDNADTLLRAYGYGNLIELYLLALLPELAADPSISPLASDAEAKAIASAEKLITIAGWDSFAVYSTRRQILRYLEWYDPLTGRKLAPLMAAAEKVFHCFPKIEKY